jgi:tyrosyl-tRNA synthetase
VTHILDDLQWRGLLAQTTDADALRAALDDGVVTYYCGFDPTAASLHVGHLTQVLTMRRLQLAGHRPLALVGGATGLIGDPRPTAERQLNDTNTVVGWTERIRDQLSRFLDFGEGPQGGLLVNNLDWTGPMDVLTFLRDVGKHFSVNRMLDREAVRARLEGQGISYTEFSYVLLQSLDYLELFRRNGCTLQIGGSDQWGNITAGVELIRRVDGGHVHALTTPLLLKSDGTKFGKTEGGSVWLDPDLTSPYAFFQYWLNADDADVVNLLKVFTFLTHEQIEELALATKERPQAREAQRALASELTALVHGEAERDAVVAASQALFGRGDLQGLSERTLAASLAELPRAVVPPGPLPPVVDLLAASGLCESKSAARRAVKEGGAYVNNRKVTDEDEAPAGGDLLHGRYLVLRRGKRHLAAVVVEG